MELFVEVLDSHWSRRRTFGYLHCDLWDRFDIDGDRGVAVGNRMAVDMPARFDVEDHVEPGLLPTHVLGRVRDKSDRKAPSVRGSLRTSGRQSNVERVVQQLENAFTSTVVLFDPFVDNPT